MLRYSATARAFRFLRRAEQIIPRAGRAFLIARRMI
jgi:hypothetical protein